MTAGAPPPRPPPPPREGGVVAQVVAALFGVQDWKRVAVLIVLGAAALIGAIIWQARERVVAGLDAFLAAPPRVEVDAAGAPAVVQRLLGLKGAMLIAVWDVRLEANRRRLVAYAAQTDGISHQLATLEPELRHGYPALLALRDANTLFIRALNGDLACGAPAPAPDVMRAMTAVGITFECIVAIPPGQAGRIAGAITAYFAGALDETQIESIRPMLWNAALELSQQEDAP